MFSIRKRAACKSVNGSHKYKGNSKDVKPPDLWIHHERLELKPVDKSPETNPMLTDTSLPRSPQDLTPGESTTEGSIHQHSNSYRGAEIRDTYCECLLFMAVQLQWGDIYGKYCHMGIYFTCMLD